MTDQVPDYQLLPQKLIFDGENSPGAGTLALIALGSSTFYCFGS